MITPLGWTTDDQITGRITPVIRWTTDDHITGMITVNTNSPRSCRRSWQPPGLLGNTAAAAATDPAGSKTGGRHPCPGSPAACGEHVAAQHDALKLAERAPGIPRARTRVRRMRTADWRVRIRWICCCDCCCLINQSCLAVLRPYSRAAVPPGPHPITLHPTRRTPEHWRQSIMMRARRIWYPHETTTWAHFLHGVKRSRTASSNDRGTSALLHPWTLW